MRVQVAELLQEDIVRKKHIIHILCIKVPKTAKERSVHIFIFINYGRIDYISLFSFSGFFEHFNVST